MNHRPAATKAAIALACTLVSGAVMAGGTVSDSACCDEYEATSPQIASVEGTTPAQITVRLRHNLGQVLHQFIGDPDSIPPGVCRAVAITWNIGVFLNRPDKFFRNLLKLSAQFNCNIDFTRSDTANMDDGSYDLVSVKPAP